MRVFFTSIFGQILLNAFIVVRGRKMLPKKKQRISLYVFVALELILFFTGFFFYSYLPDNWLVLILGVCNTWYIATIYITFLLLLVELIRFLNKKFSLFSSQLILKLKRIQAIVFGGILLVVFALLGYGYYCVVNPVVTHVYVDLSKQHAPTDSIKLLMMTDLHIGELIGEQTLTKYVDLANSQGADLMVLNGDIVDYELRFANRANAPLLLSKLHAPLGVYAILGNHEYRASIHAKKKWLKEIEGITLLVDSIVSPNGAFYLVGRDDYINKARKSLHHLLQGVEKEKPVIVADHQPAAIHEMLMNKIDLGIHGHTHAGQLWPNNWRLQLVYDFIYGLHRKGNTQFYVSSGTGSAYPPVRVGTCSEIAVLHIHY